MLLRRPINSSSPPGTTTTSRSTAWSGEELDPNAKQSGLVAAIEPVCARLMKRFKAASASFSVATDADDEAMIEAAREEMDALILFKGDMGAYVRLNTFLSQIFVTLTPLTGHLATLPWGGAIMPNPPRRLGPPWRSAHRQPLRERRRGGWLRAYGALLER